MTSNGSSSAIDPPPELHEAVPAAGGVVSGTAAGADSTPTSTGRAHMVKYRVTWFLTKLWGLTLAVGGVGLLFTNPGNYSWACVAISAYGISVLFLGGKTRMR